jgi:hypothetical protein
LFSLDCEGDIDKRIAEVQTSTAGYEQTPEYQAYIKRLVELLENCKLLKMQMDCNGDVKQRYNRLQALVDSPNTLPSEMKPAIQERDYLLAHCFSLECPYNAFEEMQNKKAELEKTAAYSPEGEADLKRYLLFLEKICNQEMTCPCDVPSRVKELQYLINRSQGDEKQTIRLTWEEEHEWLRKNCLLDQFVCDDQVAQRLAEIEQKVRFCEDMPRHKMKRNFCVLRWLRSNCFDMPAMSLAEAEAQPISP